VTERSPPVFKRRTAESLRAPPTNPLAAKMRRTSRTFSSHQRGILHPTTNTRFSYGKMGWARRTTIHHPGERYIESRPSKGHSLSNIFLLLNILSLSLSGFSFPFFFSFFSLFFHLVFSRRDDLRPRTFVLSFFTCCVRAETARLHGRIRARPTSYCCLPHSF